MKKVDILNKCLENIFHNFIQNIIIKYNYRGSALDDCCYKKQT